MWLRCSKYTATRCKKKHQVHFLLQLVSVSNCFSEIISSKLEDVGVADQDDWIESLIESLQRQSLSSNVLDLKSVRAAMKDLQ